VIPDDLSSPSTTSLSSPPPHQGGAKEGLTAVLPMDGPGAEERADGAESEAGSTSEESSGGDGVGWLDG
jgi:hypothetical protein